MAAEECGGDVSLRIYSPAIEKGIVFSQIKMTGFSDTVSPNWTEEPVYGRMDPIVTYQGTTRAMSLTFELGPFSESDNRKKLAIKKISMLMQMQYPTYTSAGSATSISRPPLLNITFHNYISEELVCYLSDVSYAPVDGMSATTVPKFNGTDILPQRISVSLNIKVLHTKAPGWTDSGEWRGAAVGPASNEDITALIKAAEQAAIFEETPLNPHSSVQPVINDGWDASTINTNNNRTADTSPAGFLPDLQPDGDSNFGFGSGTEDQNSNSENRNKQ